VALRKRLRTLLIVPGIVALGLLVYDRAVGIVWVGSTELIVELVVTDAETGEPIKGAEILVSALHDRDFKGQDQPVRMKTDRDGIVRQVCPNATTGGRESGLRFTNTWSVAPRDWILCVRADEYQGIEELTLSGPYRGTTTRTGPGRAKQVVPISLCKSRR